MNNGAKQMAVIFDPSNGKIIRQFPTLRGAKISYTRMKDKEHLVVCDDEYYGRTGAVTANEMVEVIALFTNKPVMIRRAEVGGVCDPSTERYHSM